MKPKHQINRKSRAVAGKAPLMPYDQLKPETGDTEFIIKEIETRATSLGSVLEEILHACHDRPHWS